MEYLSELVVGVAHEVNTPIGASLSAATHLQMQLVKTNTAYSKGELTESKFEDSLKTADNSVNIVISNLQRASELIRSFKRVAVDPSNHDIKQFELISYVKDVLISLRPRYKHLNLGIEVTGDEVVDIVQTSNAIAQIMTHFVVNSIMHGLAERTEGKIVIDIIKRDKQIILSYCDNGCGMSQSTIEKICEPFYTTARGRGGSGLGMHIVYNIVTSKLKGHMDINREPNKGAEFKVFFPAKAASKDDLSRKV